MKAGSLCHMGYTAYLYSGYFHLKLNSQLPNINIMVSWANTAEERFPEGHEILQIQAKSSFGLNQWSWEQILWNTC